MVSDRRRSRIAALIAAAAFIATANVRAAGDVIPIIDPPTANPGPTFTDHGNITSDGQGGRQLVVEPSGSSGAEDGWRYFQPPDLPFPGSFPTPATPAQSDIVLTADTPLIVAIPQLGSMPVFALIDIGYTIVGHEITVHASMDFTGLVTDTIYGPQEYLLSIGSLPAGDYRLTFDLDTSFMNTPSSSDTSYILFSVGSLSQAIVPEPSSAALAWIGVALVAALRRNRRFPSLRRAGG